MIIVLSVFLVIASGTMVGQTYSGGSGSSGDPYLIGNLNDLKYLSEHPAHWNLFFAQTVDIDASATSGWNTGKGFIPIRNMTTLFSDGYNGQHHIISNLFINRPTTNFIGLFGATELVVTVSNLGLIDANITGGSNVGALAGFGCQVESCYSSGEVHGVESVGGLIGYTTFASGSFANCNVTGTNYVGGFAGTVTFVFIGAVFNCYAAGDVTGSAFVGGLIGWNNETNIQWCYSVGHVTGSSSTGGLIGYSYNSVVFDCFWDTEASGQAASDGGTGKTTAEMKRAGTYLSDPSLVSSWDFTLSGGFWALNGIDNSGYPYLREESYTPGNIWLGNSSTAWTDLSNWSEGAVPVAADKVFIPDVPNDPVLTTPVGITDLTIELNGYLSLTPTGRLTVTGTFILGR